MTRRWMVITVAVLVVVVGTAGALAGVAATYDRRHSDNLLPGTVIQGVDLGGMPAKHAIRVLRDTVEAPLHQPLTVRSGTFTTETTPWDLGLRVDVRAAVNRAQGRTGSNLVTRVWNRLFTHPQRVVPAEPRWQRDLLDGALLGLADKVRIEPINAEADASSGWLVVKPGQVGAELDLERSREAVKDAVQLRDPEVRLVTQDVAPAIGKDAFQQVILIRTGENKLYLYRNGSVAKEWPVATGSSSYATPTGNWKIVEKIVNPTWYNPGSSWASGMPRVIGPGPNNPLGTHALALDAPAILIHGTPDRSSIGYNVSHGCIRMLAEHEVELFEQVDVGTPVVVVNAGTPQPRTTTPGTTSADQAAAVQF